MTEERRNAPAGGLSATDCRVTHCAPRAAGPRARQDRRACSCPERQAAHSFQSIESLERRVFLSTSDPAAYLADLSQLPGAGDRYVIDRSFVGGVILREIDTDVTDLNSDAVDAAAARSAPRSLRVAKRARVAKLRIESNSDRSAIPLAEPAAAASAFKIVLKQGPRLKANAVAAAAFRKAADFVQSLFSDPITVVVDAEIAPLGPGLIGQTGAVDFKFDYALYDEMRERMIADAAADEAIVRRLPNSNQFRTILPPDTSGGYNPFTVAGVGGSRANFLAMGMDPELLNDGPASAFDRSVKRDVSMTFSSNFNFDYDRADGIAAGKIDFTGVVIHELAHGLGFLSDVDTVDYLTNEPELDHSIYPNPLDLFRLRPGAGQSNFTNAPRVLSTGRREPNQVFYDGGVYDPVAAGFTTTGLKKGDVPMATGADHGDGQQASHWKDNDDTGVKVGALDPSSTPGTLVEWTAVDSRAMGLIGWDVVKQTPPADGSISGTAFADADGDGTRDAGEAGLSDVAVFIDLDGDEQLDENEWAVKTDSAGVYRFRPVAAGTYAVRAVAPSGSRFTAPRTAVHTVQLGAGEQRGGYAFGFQPSVASSLPAPWTSVDVGQVGTSGSASFAGGTFTVSGAGADIFGTADGFRFVHQPLAGDGEIIARVESLDDSDPFAKAGVMIRQGTAADAPNVCFVVTPAKGTRGTARLTNGATTVSEAGTGRAPQWLRLSRIGNQFAGYKSSDGLKWTLVGSHDVPMSGDVRIGLAVTSHNVARLNSAVFDHVRVSRPTPLRALQVAPVRTSMVPWTRPQPVFEEVDPSTDD